jgi:hypothetical protein
MSHCANLLARGLASRAPEVSSPSPGRLAAGAGAFRMTPRSNSAILQTGHDQLAGLSGGIGPEVGQRPKAGASVIGRDLFQLANLAATRAAPRKRLRGSRPPDDG